MRLSFDRGTLLLQDTTEGVDPAEIPGVRWDPRVGKHRAPARFTYAIASELRRRGVRIVDMPRPALPPQAGFRSPEAKSY